LTENPVSHTPQQALAAMLDHYAPSRLLHVGRSDQPALAAYAECHPECQLERADGAPLPEELAKQRYDLALFADCLEHLPKRSGLELLGSVRNLNASRMAVLVDLRPANGRPPISMPWHCRSATTSSATDRP